MLPSTRLTRVTRNLPTSKSRSNHVHPPNSFGRSKILQKRWKGHIFFYLFPQPPFFAAISHCAHLFVFAASEADRVFLRFKSTWTATVQYLHTLSQLLSRALRSCHQYFLAMPRTTRKEWPPVLYWYTAFHTHPVHLSVLCRSFISSFMDPHISNFLLALRTYNMARLSINTRTWPSGPDQSTNPISLRNDIEFQAIRQARVLSCCD